jgi:hypothetical protein
LLWIGWGVLDKLEFIATLSDKELDALFHRGGRFIVKLLDIGVSIGHFTCLQTQ